VTPLIGAAIASFGNQIITTTLITFAVDNYREKSSDIGILVNFIRQTWGFVSPPYRMNFFNYTFAPVQITKRPPRLALSISPRCLPI
jgi:hypothetical protein